MLWLCTIDDDDTRTMAAMMLCLMDVFISLCLSTESTAAVEKVVLARREDGLFKVSEKPDGTDLALNEQLPQVIPKALEGSNVSAIEAMTRLIDHSRSFETQIRIIKEMKGLDESGASMMKAA